jgi:hypothetical protein
MPQDRDRPWSNARRATSAAARRRVHAAGRLALAFVLVVLSGGTLRAQQPDPDSARIYYREARALLDGGDQRIPSPLGLLDAVTVWEDFLAIFGRDHVSKAADAFRKSLRFEPGYPPAAIGLAELAVESREDQWLDDAALALRDAVEHPEADADAWAWRARVGALRADPEAPAYARRSAELGGNRALAELAVARAEFALGADSAGAAAYSAGLDHLTPDAADAYYAELGPVVRPEERRAWGGPMEQRAAWIRTFWRRRSLESGAAPEERLAEHYRRVAYATELYRRAGKRRIQMVAKDALSGDTVLVEGRDLGLDDRGTVYLLHGEPDEIVRTTSCANPNETWLYLLPESRLVFHFAALGSGQQFSLVSGPISACMGSGLEVNSGNLDVVLQALEDRRDIDPRLGIQANRLRSNAQDLASANTSMERQRVLLAFTTDLFRFEADARTEALAALERDSHSADLGLPIPFFYDTYAFRGHRDSTDLVVAFAVPGERLPSTQSAGSYLYPLRLVVAVADTVADVFFRADTARTFASGVSLTQGEHLRATLELEVPPGEAYTHSVTLRTTGEERVGGAYGGPIEIPDFSGAGLAISDIVLGESGDSWRRGNVSLGLVPPRRYVQGSTIAMYYEIYGLADGDEPVRTAITVKPVKGGLGGFFRRLFGGGSGEISLEFQDRPEVDATGTAQVLRTVNARGLEPGGYRMTVEVETDAGTVRRDREFVVLDPDDPDAF